MSNENTLESLRNTIISSMGRGTKRPGDSVDGGVAERTKVQRLVGAENSNSGDHPAGGPGVTKRFDTDRSSKSAQPQNGYRNVRREERNGYGLSRNGNANEKDAAPSTVQSQNPFTQRGSYSNYPRNNRDTRGHYNNRHQPSSTYEGNPPGNFQHKNFNNYNNNKYNPYRAQPNDHYNKNPSIETKQLDQRVPIHNSYQHNTSYRSSHNHYNKNGNNTSTNYGNTRYSTTNRYNQNNSFNKNYPNQNKINNTNTVHNKNYIPPAFRDANRYEKITNSIVNNKLIIEGNLSADLVQSLKNIISNLIQNQDFISDQEKNLTQIDYKLLENESTLIITFNHFNFTVLIMSCSKFIQRELGIDITIRRPNSYVEQVDNMNKFHNQYVLAVQEPIDPVELTKFFNSDKYETIPIKYLDNATTNCQIIMLDKTVKLPKPDSKLPIIRPNEGKLKQCTTRLLFSDMLCLADPQLIPAQDKINKSKFPIPPKTVPESNVLLIMNAMDPTDLEDETFVSEIKDTLAETLTQVEDIKIITPPRIDYRLNIDHVAYHVGNIYVKFKDTESCKENVALIQGAQFNDRTLLCAYVDARDFDMGVLDR